jgi:hypothetical protein
MFSVSNILVILCQILNRNLFVVQRQSKVLAEGKPEPLNRATLIAAQLGWFSVFYTVVAVQTRSTKYKLDILNVPVVENNALCENSLALSMEILNEQTNTSQETHNTDRKRKLVIILPSEIKSFIKNFTILKYFKQFESWQGRLLGSRISYCQN